IGELTAQHLHAEPFDKDGFRTALHHARTLTRTDDFLHELQGAGGIVPGAVQVMVDAGARAEDISVLLGPAVSGRNYEVPAEMADEVERALPGSRTTTGRG
ncbi:laccase domain-containing protein, partial [Mycobacterium rufum]|nr:laccase domain-containing protein [Mycolicibacterium rufum]